MRAKILFISLIVAITACENNTSKIDSNAKKIDGLELFKNNCISCHGAKGDMGMNGAKDLTTSTLPLEQRVELISNGKGLMTPFKTLLNDEEIQAVAEYTLRLQAE